MNLNVFINCPFDDDYTEILHAITFVVICSGFIPRSALETKESGEARLAKIIRIISECRLGIHDISRVEPTLSGGKPLPRFNMPFEFGIFYGAMHVGDDEQRKKQLLVLDSEEYRYQKTISDIAGSDPAVHHSKPLEAMAHIRDFLSDKNGGGTLPGAEQFERQYIRFGKALPKITRRLSISPAEIKKRRYWRDYVVSVQQWLMLPAQQRFRENRGGS
jgi:hypothetical protein